METPQWPIAAPTHRDLIGNKLVLDAIATLKISHHVFLGKMGKWVVLPDQRRGQIVAEYLSGKNAQKAEDIRTNALEEPDLEPFWRDISEI